MDTNQPLIKTEKGIVEFTLAAVAPRRDARDPPFQTSVREAVGKIYDDLNLRIPTRDSKLFELDGRGDDYDPSEYLPLAFGLNDLRIVFGKFDTLITTRLPHVYWSNVLRQGFSVSKALGDFFSIPTTRLLAPWCEPPAEDPASASEYPISILTFLSFPEAVLRSFTASGNIDGTEPDGKVRRLSEHLADVVQWLIGTTPQTFGLSMAARFPECGVRAYLTLATYYPLVVTARCRDLHHLDQFLSTLRSPTPAAGTSTIISVRGSSVWSEHGTPNEHLSAGSQGRPATISMLLKVRPGSDDAVKVSLEKGLTSALGGDLEILRTLNRPSFWDIFSVFSTARVGALVDFVTNTMGHTIKDIEQCVTIPYWDWEDVQDPPDKMFARLSKPRVPHAQLENADKANRHCQEWFPEGLRATPRTAEILDRRYYNLKFDLEWLFGQFAQLAEGWTLHKLPGAYTFQRAADLVQELFGEIEEIGTTIGDIRAVEKLLEAARAKVSAPGAVNHLAPEEIEYVREHTPELEENKRKEIGRVWETLYKLEKDIASVRKLLPSLRSEFHLRTQCLQAISVTEPHILFGDRSGATEMYHVAASHLVDSYCGKWKWAEAAQQPAGNGVVPTTAGLWQGIVVASPNVRDWWINPFFQHLALPAELKAHVERRLLPLAHEACHQMLFELTRRETSTASRELLGIWRDVRDEAMQQCGALGSVLREIARGLRDECVARATLDWHNEVFQKLSDPKPKTLDRSELLVDVLSFLAAGPAMVKTLAEVAYSPFETSKDHGPVWLRIFLGDRLFECLGLNRSAEDNPWMFPAGKPPLIENVMKQQATADDVVDMALEILESETDAWPNDVVNHLRTDPDSVLFCENTHLLRALLRDNCFFIRKIALWCQKHSNDFLFYEVVAEGSEDERGAFSRSSIMKGNSLSVQTATRLVDKQEILVDTRVRHIAAASMLNHLPRPGYPSERIIHSIYYGKSRKELTTDT